MQPSWNLKRLRWSALFLGVSNVLVIIIGIVLIFGIKATCRKCDVGHLLVIVLLSCLRIPAMIFTAIAQRDMAIVILNSVCEGDVIDTTVVRQQRQNRHKRWTWCKCYAIAITAVQLLEAAYLLFNVTKSFYQDRAPNNSVIGFILNSTKENVNTLILFTFIVSCTTLVQCFTGSDVLRWRSFYATESNLWKAHYQEVFDHDIRRALCCLGRLKYTTAPEEDDIYSVAQLLGDLVTYRATGTGHLELLAGLALLQKCVPFDELHDELLEIPTERVHEAAAFHQFAEAAYTGLLLDIGRNPLMFPCAWLYRQGVFNLWRRSRISVVEGDNWWQGHAAAFLRHVKLTPDVLKKGRVNKGKCKASYFLIVAHHLKSVVIAVRGTETPEDLITDGLGRECTLKIEDLDGLINGKTMQPGISQRIVSSQPHYGHSGVVEAAQDLYMQVEGNSTHGGYLSSLLGAGCECEGYKLRIVGHSLGGAIAALLGFQLYRQYPNLHVYAYGPLPCLDFVAANACSNFVTSVVLNNEFSSRLSVASIMRLRAAAITALSQCNIAGSTMVSRLACNPFLFRDSKEEKDTKAVKQIPHISSTSKIEPETTQYYSQIKHGYGTVGSREEDVEACLQERNKEDNLDSKNSLTNLKHSSNSTSNISTFDADHLDPLSELADAIPTNEVGLYSNIPEMFVPGLVVHIIPTKKNVQNPLWKRWSTWGEDCSYKAYIANRESFKDIIVSPSMFLDHLPWRCYSAIEKIQKMGNC